MNIAKILKNCPKGTKLYSLLFGEVILDCVKDDTEYPIHCLASDGGYPYFMSDGRYFGDYTDSECVLFPAKDQRDWSKFGVSDKKTKHQFKPFDKVLVRDGDNELWQCNMFSHIEGIYVCFCSYWQQCIPYEGNEHLLGTTNKPEE